MRGSDWIKIYTYMNAPINTQHKTSHFSNPSVAVGPPVSTAFSYTNGASASGRRRKHAQSACFHSVCLGNAVETWGPTVTDGFQKCEVLCWVLIGALIYIYIYIYMAIPINTHAKLKTVLYSLWKTCLCQLFQDLTQTSAKTSGRVTKICKNM